VTIATVGDLLGKGTHTYIAFDYVDGGVDVQQTPDQIIHLLSSGGPATA
jgi:hypothetical protein